MKAGFSRLDITPPLGVRLGGYYYERLAEGVQDPLYVNALAVNDGDKTAVVIVCDLLGIYNDCIRQWPQQIGEAVGVDAESVFVCHTHTHTGPVICGTREPSDPMYDAWLFRRLCDAATMAIRDLKPVTSIRSFEGDCTGITFVRRFKMKGGFVQTWANWLDPDIEDYAGEGDESLRLVRIAREEGEELVLVNFQTHPDNVSSSMYSADFPAFLRNHVEAAKPGTKCIYFNGAEGQMVTADWWYGTGRLPKYVKAIQVGKDLAEYVLAHFDEVQPVEGEGVRFGQSVTVCKTKWSAEKREELMAEAERLIEIHERGADDAEIGPDWIATPLVAEAYQLRRLDAGQLSEVPMKVSAVTFGGLALLGIPGEPFCEIGKHIRDNSPYPVTFVCCQTNGCEGYYPTAEAYDQGGYEPRNTRFPKGIGEILMEAGDELLKRI
jgi:hypothetical protein